MRVSVQFWSYFKDLAGCGSAEVELPADARLGDLLTAVYRRHPKLAAMEKSTLVAVGVEYQTADYRLQPGDVVSLFPPVQGG